MRLLYCIAALNKQESKSCYLQLLIGRERGLRFYSLLMEKRAIDTSKITENEMITISVDYRMTTRNSWVIKPYVTLWIPTNCCDVMFNREPRSDYWPACDY